MAEAFKSTKRAPAKGGDGGQAARHVNVSRDSSSNERVYLNAINEDQKRRCIPTRDISDRAHGQMGPNGMLVPAARRGKLQVFNSKSRKYPECQMNNKGVAVDSSFDENFFREQWLMQAGLLAGTTTGIRYDTKIADEFMPKVRRRRNRNGEGSSEDEPANDR